MSLGKFHYKLFRYTPFYISMGGCKYDLANFEKLTSDGKVELMTDAEAKKYLDKANYKRYQDRIQMC